METNYQAQIERKDTEHQQTIIQLHQQLQVAIFMRTGLSRIICKLN